MNDLYPEEQDPQFEELITLLRHADLNPPLIDPSENEQIIANARDRLFPPATEVTQPDIDMHVRGYFPSTSKTQGGKHGILVRLVNTIAAVLVVAALIGSAFLLFGPLRGGLLGTTPSNKIFGTPKRVGPFEMRLEITPGPYFLDEVLEVDLSITNVTHTAYWLYPNVGKNSPCFKLLNIATTGGGSPHVTDFEHYWDSLPWPSPNCSSLVHSLPTSGILVPANQMLGIPHYYQLTSSGWVILTTQLDALEVNAVSRHGTNIPASFPWGSLSIFVSSHIPSDRQLTVKQQQTQVVVSGPPAVKGHLLGKIGSVCPDFGLYIEGLGEPSAPPVVLKPAAVACGNNGPKPLWWTYVVGAPGFPVYFGKVNGS